MIPSAAASNSGDFYSPLLPCAAPRSVTSRWSVLQSVVNLPAILNDPKHRQLDIFSHAWGDQFEHAEVIASPRLPHITEADFLAYLDSVRPHEKLLSTASPRTRKQDVLLQAVRSSTPSCQFPAQMQQTLCDATNTSTSLDSIPSIFLTSSDFNLRNRETFERVIPLHSRREQANDWCSISLIPEQTVSSSRRDVTCVSLQESDFRTQHERLANFLDIVEVRLAEQVAQKSSVFFEAVCCHDVVREQLRHALEQISLARVKLRQLDSHISSTTMRLLRVVRRRENYRTILEKLKVIAGLKAAQPTIQSLLRNNDFCTALDLVASIEDLLITLFKPPETSADISITTDSATSHATHSVSPRSLNGSSRQYGKQLLCLRHFSAQLREISHFVHQMITTEFELALCRFLQGPHQATSIGDQSIDSTDPDLHSCFLGLLHIRRHDFAQTIRTELYRQIKKIGSDTLLTVSSNFSSELTSSEKEKLTSIPPKEWINLVLQLCSGLHNLFLRAEKATELFEGALYANLETNVRTDEIADGCPERTLTSSPDGGKQPEKMPSADEFVLQLRSVIRDSILFAEKQVVGLIAPRTTSNCVDSCWPGMLRITSFNSTFDSDGLANAEDVWSEELYRLIITLDDFQHLLSQSSEELTQTNTTTTTTTTTVSDNTVPSATVNHSLDDEQRRSKLHSARDPPAPTNRPPPPVSLRVLIVRIVRDLVNQFHCERMEKLRELLDLECWQAVPVPLPVQRLVDQTLGSTDCDGPRLKARWSITANAIPSANGLAHVSAAAAATAKTAESASSRKTKMDAAKVNATLRLHETDYVLVGTVLLLFPMLTNYLQLATKLPRRLWLRKLITERLVNLLILFNSRTCQLLLGTQALETASLSTISARTLALASRSLQFVATCVSCLHVYLDRIYHVEGTSDGSADPNNSESAGQNDVPPSIRNRKSNEERHSLQRVNRLIQEHIDDIHCKLNNMLSDRMQEHLSAWRVRPPTPSPELRAVCRALTRVVETTSDILPVNILMHILLVAHDNFKRKLRLRLNELAVTADGGPQQSLVDSELNFYLSQFRSLCSPLRKFVDDFSDVWHSPEGLTAVDVI